MSGALNSYSNRKRSKRTAGYGKIAKMDEQGVKGEDFRAAANKDCWSRLRRYRKGRLQ